jgi:outer membrane protein
VLILTALAIAMASSPAGPPPDGTVQVEVVSGLNPGQLFLAAERLLTEGRKADAERLLTALSEDPDRAVRNEARFRLSRLREADGRRSDAAVLLRRILDEEPDAARVRLELARLLFLIGEESGARQQLRQAQNNGLPPDLARVVDQFRQALRSRAPLGATVEVALAPDSNINRATTQGTIDTGIFPIDLDADAQAQSGLGIALSGQGFARVRIGKRLSLVPRATAAARLYRDGAFSDINLDTRVGLERTDSTFGRLTLSLGYERRWFGGEPLSTTGLVALDWLRPLNTTTQLTISASASRQRFATNRAQDGELFQSSIGYEKALSRRTGVSLSVSGARQEARDPGYANYSGGLMALAYAEVGRSTLFTSLTARRLKADAPFFLFTEARREWLVRSVLGGTFRQATIAGFAPVVRLIAERNTSAVALFDYRRLAAEIGITRAF